MATETVSTPGTPEGTSVGAYPVSRWREDQLPPSGAPLGAAINSQTVANQQVTFTGLTAGTDYFAAPATGARYYRFSVDADTPGGTVQPGLNTVGAAQIQDGSVGTAELADGAVTAAKLASTAAAKLMRKSADQTLTPSNTTPQDLADLVFAVLASEVWYFEFQLFVLGPSITPDLKLQFGLPAGATIKWDGTRGFTAVGASPAALSTTTLTAGLDALEATYRGGGVIVIAGTAGNATLQASQNTSDPSNVVVKQNSILQARRIA